MTQVQNKISVCTVDFETRSFLNVIDVGAWRYAESPTTEILCLAYKFDSGPTKLWLPFLPFPQEIIDHIEAGGMFEAHNVQFERAVWQFILSRQMGIPMPKRWRDTLAVCAYRGIPLSLDNAGKALGLPIQKDKRGEYLLQTLSTPKGATKKEPNRLYREDWDLMDELYDYCITDVDSEYCLSETLGPLPPSEYGLWVLDQKINQRGVCLDKEAVIASLQVIKLVEDKYNNELMEITGNAVKAATQRDKLLNWIRENSDLTITNLTKETLESLLLKDKKGRYINLKGVDKGVQRAIFIRSQLAKSSTKKLEKMMETVSRDNRIRGLLQYHGAATGRWAGRLVQPQNFPRASVTNMKSEDGKKKWLNMDLLVDHIKEKNPEKLDEIYGSAMTAVSSALRGMFIAGEKKHLYICDFSAIEARVTFWVANCEVGLEVFHKSDRGESEDIYCVTASDLVGFEVKKKEHNHERQLGKITILGCGYQMGWEKLQYQAEKDYSVLLSEDDSRKMVTVYRQKYNEVPSFWYRIQEAAIETVKTGSPHGYHRIRYDLIEDKAGRWLCCTLPNGRALWYYDPVVTKNMTPWGMKDSLTYMGRNNKQGGNWSRITTYGGMLTENIVQAIARDLMAEAMIRVEKKGYPIILTVHDEIIAETDLAFGSQEEFESEMAAVPPWATGCPIAVEGGVVTRYQKV